jgi:hypothetical protein
VVRHCQLVVNLAGCTPTIAACLELLAEPIQISRKIARALDCVVSWNYEHRQIAIGISSPRSRAPRQCMQTLSSRETDRAKTAGDALVVWVEPRSVAEEAERSH